MGNLPNPKEILCKSYTPSLAQSNSISKRLPTQIAIGPSIARNVKPDAL
jgi:hypothetical protein